jgi:Leucine-rich repeat (LRR) protein
MKNLSFLLLFALQFAGLSLSAQIITDAKFAAAIRKKCPDCISIFNALLPKAATLKSLDVSFADIKSLAGMEGFAALESLYCNNNELTSLPTLPSSLENLDCHDNPLKILPILPNSLKSLYCQKNQLTSLPTLPNSLTKLYCVSNPFTSLPTLPASLEELYISDKITCLPNQVEGLRIANIRNETITPPTCSTPMPKIIVSDPKFAAAIRRQCPTCIDSTNLLLPAATTLTVLNVTKANITNLAGIEGFTALKELTCIDNKLKSLPTLPNSLQNLKCYVNQLSSLPTLPTALQYLDCSFNELTSLPTLPASLTYLDCHGTGYDPQNNPLKTLPTLPNALKDLNCSGTKLTNLPTLPNALSNLECSDNELTSLPTLPNALSNLKCDDNKLTRLPNLPNALKSLSCNNNPLTNLPTLPPSLQELRCFRSQLTRLPTLPPSLTSLRIDKSITCIPNEVAGLRISDDSFESMTRPICRN